MRLKKVKTQYPMLILGDCIEAMRKLKDNSVDTIITSPPYNKKGLSGKRNVGNNIWKKFNIDYDLYNDDMNEEDYAKWQIEFLNECFRVLKPDGSLFYNHKVRRANNKAHFPTWVFESDLIFYQMIIWDRKNCCDVRNDYLYPNTELIFWLTKGKPKVYKSQAPFQKEVWSITPSKSKLHPATFPNSLANNCILLTTQEGDVVLDPFMGSGTVGVECSLLNRKFIGIELSKNYYDLSCNQIKEVTN